MSQMMTMTLRAAGLADNRAAASDVPLARAAGALRRALGFAITAGGFVVIGTHLLARAAGG
jgi:hypothetical protein